MSSSRAGGKSGLLPPSSGSSASASSSTTGRVQYAFGSRILHPSGKENDHVANNAAKPPKDSGVAKKDRLAAIKPPRANKRRRSLVSGIPPPQISNAPVSKPTSLPPSAPPAIAAEETDAATACDAKQSVSDEDSARESLPLPPPPPLPSALQELTTASEPGFWTARQAVAQSALRELQALE
ncbi:hypothetical protein ATCC90586_004485 [Pythium insidiosum]|nr:hypothetical protein ATCC90586_004485 [Pythium insidiosum]